MNAKRLSLTLLLFSVGVMAFVYWANSKNAALTGPVYAAQDQAQTAPAEASPTTAPAAAPAAASTAPAATPAEATPTTAPAATADRCYTDAGRDATYTQLGGLGQDSPYKFEVDVSSVGGGIYTIKLKDHFATVRDKRRAQKDPAEYEQALASGKDELGGHYSLINPVAHHGERYLAYATRGLLIKRADGSVVQVDLSGLNWNVRPQAPTSPQGPQNVSLGLTIYCGPSAAQAKALLEIVKTYTVSPGDYSIDMNVQMRNLSGEALEVTLDQYGATGVPREDIKADDRQAVYGYLKGGNAQAVRKPRTELDKWSTNAADLFLNVPRGTYVGSSRNEEPMLWMGEANRFFASMFYVKPQGDSLAAEQYDARFYLAARNETADSLTFLAGVQIPSINIAPGQSQAVAMDIFAGPKDRDLLQQNELYKKLNYIGVIDMGSCFCAFDWLILGMMWLLSKLSIITLGNYGLAIILLVLIVRVVLHPLTKRGQVNMMKMQKLGPAMQKIKEKYKDDKNAMNQEMMRFYKQQGATPLLGCLPMLLQMPIWIALWTGLNAAIELRHAAFLPVWLTDLSAPDTILSWSTPLPLLGTTSLHLLPLLLALAMYLQAKLNPQAMGASTAVAQTPEQQQQQKMMKVMMPVMMLFIFYSAPSGLTLYIMTSTFAGVAEQFVIRKHIKEKEEQEAAAEVRMDVPGKAARSSRPKKPKGPFWHKNG